MNPAESSREVQRLNGQTCPPEMIVDNQHGYLQVEFLRGTVLSVEHVCHLSDLVMGANVAALMVVCSGLNAADPKAMEAGFASPGPFRVAYVGAGDVDRLLVHFFNRFDAVDYEWRYFEDRDAAHTWLQDAR